MGEEVAKALADKYRTIDHLYLVTKESLHKIHGIGKILGEEIYSFFHDQNNIAMIKTLVSLKVNITKTVSLHEFIYQLDIKGLGEEEANALADKYRNVERLYFISREQLQEIHEISGRSK